MSDYANLLRQLRKVQSGIQWDAADAIEALEKERDEARAVARRATDEWAVHARVAELEKERDEARIALGGHATGDFSGDDGCGCTMLSLPKLCETHHRWLKDTKARVAELEGIIRSLREDPEGL